MRASTTLLFLSCGLFSFSQDSYTNEEGQTITVTKATNFTITPPLSEWPTIEDGTKTDVKEVRNHFLRNEVTNPNALPIGVDPALQTEPGFRAPAGTIANFAGLNGNAIPPDPTGSVGTDAYVQAVNLAFKAYSKTGGTLAGPFSLSSLWPGSNNAGDPIVMYDRHADRWFISQFQFSPNEILVAISQTNDPTGSYFTYTFNMGQFPDYPKYSVWWDGYYMTSNSNQTAVVFERDKMLAGDPTASAQILSAPSLNTGFGGFKSPLPADADGPLPPNGTPMYIFHLEDDGWSGVSQDRIKVYEMTTDWVNPGNTSVSISQTITTQSFNSNFGFGFDNIAQPGTTQKLDAIPGVFYFRAQHMRWTGYNTIMLCHVVDMNNNDHAGLRWYELRDSNDGNWSIHQQGTYAPDDGHRWMGSISMDENGHVGMAYSYTDPANTIYPGLRYTARLASDPLGQMTFVEQIAVNGTGNQTSGNRYGDYAHMSLDPDGTTLWYTGEWLSVSGRRTRIFSFDISASVGVEETLSSSGIELTALIQDGVISINIDPSQYNGSTQLDLIDIHGRVLESRNLMLNGQVLESFPANDLSSGIYFVRLGNMDFQQVERIVIGK